MSKCVTVSHMWAISKALLYHSEDSLMVAPKECRRILEEILCICYVYIPLQVRLVL